MTIPNDDPAHRATDEALSDLEKRIHDLYDKAAKDMQDKVDRYFDSLTKRDEEYRELVESGKKTEADYKAWRVTQLGRGERYEAMRDALAERMTHANEIAASYINDETPNIYALNRNFNIEDAINMSNGMLDGINFIQYDEHTVKRLLKEQPDLMPYYPKEKAVDRGIDLEYGKKQITKSVTSGLLKGDSTKKIAKNLMDNIKGMERDSAIRAARTSITNAANAGRQAGDEELAEQGAVIKKGWVCIFHNSRKDHEDAYQKYGNEDGYIDIDEPFEVGGELLMFPGDGSMGASGWNLYNCQCYRARKVVGFKSILSPEQRKRANIRVVSG